MKTQVSVIGVPMWLGQTRYGTNLAPEAIRAAGILDQLRNAYQDVRDMGDIAISNSGSFKIKEERIKNVRQVAAACEKLAEEVAGVVRQRRFPLVLGGDHSIAIGTLAGLAQSYHRLGVIWFDAHADMNTPETTPSGNIHGMPLAVSMGWGHSELVNIGGAFPKIRPEHLVLVGARSIDAGERRLIEEKQIKVFTMEDIHRRGIADVMREAVDYLSAQCDGIHLSFDMDGIDPSEAPGVGTPVTGGVTYADSLTALQVLARSGRIASAEFVELNPILDAGNQTAAAAVRLMMELMEVHGKTELLAAQQRKAAAGMI